MRGIVYENHDVAFKETVFGIDGDGAHVHFQGVGNDAGYVVYQAYAVGTFYADTG